MSNIIAYVEQINFDNFFQKIIEKILSRIYIENYSCNKYRLLINTVNINERVLNRAVLKLEKRKIDTVVLSKEVTAWKNFFLDNNIQVLDGKNLMKSLLKDIVKYIYQNKEESICNEDLYVVIDNEKNIDIILDTAELFKCLNIVTKKINKLKRLDNRLENNSDIVYSITSNKKKGLRKAKIIVNFDYDENFFGDVKLNRKAIIINLNDRPLQLSSTFNGAIVENVDINYRQADIEKKYFSKFNKSAILESNVYSNSYYKVKEHCKMLDCRIVKLVGKNGNISAKEIKNIYLDK